MSLNRFINIEEILGETEDLPTTIGETFEEADSISSGDFTLKPLDGVLSFPSGNFGFPTSVGGSFEFHIYNQENELLRSLYNNPLNVKQYYVDDKGNQASNQYFLAVSPEADLDNNDFNSGFYTIVYNPIYNFAGAFDGSSNSVTDLKIEEISSDRTELKVRVKSNYNLGLIKDIQDLKYEESTDYVFTKDKPEFLLNFGENNIYDVSKIYFQGTSYSDFSLPTSTFGPKNLETIWLPTNYPITPRGHLFEEYYKDIIKKVNDVEKYSEQTGRLAFFKEKFVTNSDGIVEGSWEIERYTETDYTIGYNLDRSFINAPFYFHYGVGNILSRIDGALNILIGNKTNDKDELNWVKGLASKANISIGEYDPPGQSMGYYVAGASAVGVGVAGVVIAGQVVTTTLTSTLVTIPTFVVAGSFAPVSIGTTTVAVTTATTTGFVGPALSSFLAVAGPVLIVAGAALLFAGAWIAIDKEVYFNELDRSWDGDTNNGYLAVKRIYDDVFRTRFNGTPFEPYIGLGATLNKDNIAAAAWAVNDAIRSIEDLDRRYDALSDNKKRRGEGRQLQRRIRSYVTILLQIRAWLEAHKLVFNFESFTGTADRPKNLPANSKDGVYISLNYDNDVVNAEPISRKVGVTSAVLVENSKGNVNFVDSSFNKLYIKLISPLDISINTGRSFSIDGRLQQSYIDRVYKQLIYEDVPKTQLLEPNFNIELDKYGKSDGTDFKAWNDLLDANLSTSQQIIDNYFSGSFGNIKLNIDYSDFSNFVHYSSATERVDNFFSKLQTIEGYNSRIATLQQVSGSHALTNISQSITRRDTLIGGFDGFEQWMYNKVTGSLYTHYSTTDNPIVPYPKISSYPTVFYATTSSQAESWYEGVYSSASLYDSQNQSALINLIPFALREDPLNEDYILFIDMMGQHFDILWTYTKALTDINKREEHPEDGISDDLLYDVAKSMGWYLSNGWGDANLWEYVLGTDSSGNKSVTTGGLETKSKKKIRSEVWRRVLNNLPYIYKSKGTSRSIKALLACYGIPSVFLKIREYGGPTVVDSPNKYETERFIYKVETTDSKPIRNPFGTINGSRPNTIEVIGKMPLGDFTIGRLTGGGTDLNFEWNYSGGQARILAKTGTTTVMSSSYMNYKVARDGAFGIVYDGSSTTIRAAFKDDFGNILASLFAQSSAPNSILGSSTQFIVGDGVGNYSSTASIQEIRYYSSSLSEEIFKEHALNTEAYFSDDNTTDVDNSQISYKNLVYRIFPDSGFSTTPTAISSSHPNQFFKTTSVGAPLTASLPSHTSTNLVGEVDTQFVKVPSAGTLNDNNNKVRIESSVLSGSLDVEKTGEVSQYDYTPLDSNLVGLYFSPTDVVNDDIYNSEGYFEIDDWVGDPDDRFNDDYPLLKWRAGEYFKKYVNLTAPSGSAQRRGTAIGLLLDMLSLYDHSIFQQAKQLIPARSEYIGGVLLEPHILERNKYKRGDKWSHTRMDYPLLLEDNPAVLQSTKNDYLGVIESVVTEVTSEKSDYLGVIESVVTEVTSEKSDYSVPVDVKDFHEGAVYAYTQPILSGSTGLYINVQNAYWERAVTSSIMDQRLSPYGKQRTFLYSSPLSASLGKFYSSTLVPYPSVQTDELPLSLANLRFNGCNSGVTSIDGLPSVQTFTADPFVIGVAPQNVTSQNATVSSPRPNRPVGSGVGGSGRASSGRLFV